MFITALDDLASKRKGFYSGVDDYMVKPVDMDEMAAYVNGEEVPILPREFNVYIGSERKCCLCDSSGFWLRNGQRNCREQKK